MATIKAKQLDTGTTANKVVALDSNAKLPAVAGDTLTALPALNTHSDINAGSPSAGQVLTWDSSAAEWQAQNAAGGLSFDSVTIGSGGSSQTLVPNRIYNVYATSGTTTFTTPLLADCSDGDIIFITTGATNTITFTVPAGSTNAGIFKRGHNYTQITTGTGGSASFEVNGHSMALFYEDGNDAFFLSIQTEELNSLRDVVVSNPSDGQVLKYVAGQQRWEVGTALTNLSSTAPSDGQILQYSSSAQEWQPANKLYIPQSIESGTALSIGSSDENKLFLLTDVNTPTEVVTLPSVADIDNNSIFTINTLNDNVGNRFNQIQFNLSSADRTSNDSANTVLLNAGIKNQYQNTADDSTIYFLRNGSPIHILKTSTGYQIFGETSSANNSLFQPLLKNYLSLSLLSNTYNYSNSSYNNNALVLPDLTNNLWNNVIPDGTPVVWAFKTQTSSNKYADHIFQSATDIISSVDVGGVATLNGSVYEYTTSARKITFVRHGTKWLITEEVGGVKPLSLLERHNDNSYHILGNGSSTVGELKLYCESANAHYTALKAAAHADYTGGNATFALPGTNGTNGQLLQTDGSGNTSWVTPSSGGSAPNVYTETSSFTVGSGSTDGAVASTEFERIYLINNSATAVTVTLPAISGNVGAGFKLQIKRLGTANVTVSQNSTELIDGVASQVLSVQYSSFTLTNDGTNWYII